LNLVEVGRSAAHAAGEKLGTSSDNRCAVNVGTSWNRSSPPALQVGGGQDRRRL